MGGEAQDGWQRKGVGGGRMYTVQLGREDDIREGRDPRECLSSQQVTKIIKMGL
jgi:hypothetical protein